MAFSHSLFFGFFKLFCLFTVIESEFGEYKTLVLPVLDGKQYKLGCLYNQRTAQIVAGCTFNLWNDTTLKILGNIRSTETQQLNARIVEYEGFSQKGLHFRLNAETRASLLFGLITFYGAATFLKYQSETSYGASVAFTYETQFYTKSLSSDIIMAPDKRISPGIQDATHVVIKINYGGKAVLAFEETFQTFKESNKKTGSLIFDLQNQLGKIQDGKNLNLTKEERKNYGKNLKCSFQGDHIDPLDKPCNLEEGLKQFARYPTVITKETAKPVTVVLFPVDRIVGAEVNKLWRSINSHVLEILEEFQVKLDGLTQSVGDLKREPAYKNMQKVKKHIDTFAEVLKMKKLKLKQKIKKDLVNARNSGDYEETLLAIVEDHQEFIESVEEWIAIKKKECVVLKWISEWNPSKIYQSVSHPDLLQGRKRNVVVVYLQVYPDTDAFTSCISDDTRGKFACIKPVSWYNTAIGRQIRNTFLEFINAEEATTNKTYFDHVSETPAFGIVEQSLEQGTASMFTKFYEKIGNSMKESFIQFPAINNVRVNRNCTHINIYWESLNITNAAIPSYSFTVRYKTNRKLFGSTQWVNLKKIESNEVSVSVPFYPGLEYRINAQILRKCRFGYCARTLFEYPGIKLLGKKQPNLEICDACPNNPCRNYGKCNENKKCSCPKQFYGSFCQFQEEKWTSKEQKTDCEIACQNEFQLKAKPSETEETPLRICKAKTDSVWQTGWILNATFGCHVPCCKKENCSAHPNFKCLCETDGTKWVRSYSESCVKVCEYASLAGPVSTDEAVNGEKAYLCRTNVTDYNASGHAKLLENNGNHVCCAADVQGSQCEVCSSVYECLCRMM